MQLHVDTTEGLINQRITYRLSEFRIEESRLFQSIIVDGIKVFLCKLLMTTEKRL